MTDICRYKSHRYTNFHQNRACRRMLYTWYMSIWEGLWCELALLQDGPLCCRLTCTFLFSAFKLADLAPTTKLRNVVWRAFCAEFYFFPVNMWISFSPFIPTTRNKRKMYFSWRIVPATFRFLDCIIYYNLSLGKMQIRFFIICILMILV